MRTAALVTLLAVTLLSAPSVADDERDFLKQAQAELAQMQVRVKAAEDAADPDARIHFRYDWLRRDIAIIRRGIQAHIDAQYLNQSSKTKLRGDYRQ